MCDTWSYFLEEALKLRGRGGTKKFIKIIYCNLLYSFPSNIQFPFASCSSTIIFRVRLCFVKAWLKLVLRSPDVFHIVRFFCCHHSSSFLYAFWNFLNTSIIPSWVLLLSVCIFCRTRWNSPILFFLYGEFFLRHLTISCLQLFFFLTKSLLLLSNNYSHPLLIDSIKPSWPIHFLSNLNWPHQFSLFHMVWF